jgi:hypothetical protein
VNTPENHDEGPAPKPPARRSRLLLLLLLVVVVVLGWAANRAKGYVAREDAFCAGACHAPKDAAIGWHAGGHKGISCQTCHAVPSGTGYALLWKKLTSGKPSGKHGAVTAATCRDCHQKLESWVDVDATEGHKQHRDVKDTDCLSCHGANAHKNEKSTERDCLRCHDKLRLHAASTDPKAETCMTCHAFDTAPRSSHKAVSTTCRECHADAAKMASRAATKAKESMTVFDDKTVHGGLNCKLCHDPHGKKKTTPADGKAFCSQCHKLDLLSFPDDGVGPEQHRKCDGCHVPHAARDQVLVLCTKCHEKIVKPAGQEKTTALAHKSCASCHRPHLWKSPQNGCVPCHAQQANLVAMRSPPQHGTCVGCHQVHGPKPTGAVCVDCHSKSKKNHVALAPEKHKDCTACHSPHTPAPAETKSACVRCHDQQLADVVRGPSGHSKEGCFGCHQPHDSPKAKVDVCAKCHQAPSRLVASATVAEHRDCASCHTQHKFSIDNPKAACLSCHGPAQAGKAPKSAAAVVIDATGAHKGACKDCHTQHGPPTVQKSACFACHATVQKQFKEINATHGVCASCHQPHKPAALAKDKCQKCHEPQSTAASKWPAKSAHAGPCANCHQPHDAKAVKTCAECHDKEAKSALGGKHACAQCHAPHKAPAGTGAGWWASCASESCHAAKATAVKSRGPKHSDCKSCHTPHRYASPTCASCHDMSKRGLHSGKQHSKCNDCHDTHAKSEFKREQCIKCHANMRDHQPTATQCQGCHVFK